MIVGFAPGGATDIVARLIGQWLSERFGQQFVIENRPGAASNMGTEVVVNAPPDGYTLLVVTSVNTINATLYERLNFNLTRDIVPVASIHREPFVVEVNPAVPVKDDSRVHRPRQDESRKDQHGVSRRRLRKSHCRRTVQDDDRCQPRACAVSRRRPCADRSARRTGQAPALLPEICPS